VKSRFAEMKLFARRTCDVKCNWKTYVDNYLEGVPPAQRASPDGTANWISTPALVESQARRVRQFSPIRGAQPGAAMPRRYLEAGEDWTRTTSGSLPTGC